MANERLTLQIDTVTTGQQQVEALSQALNKVVNIADKAGNSGSAFSSFPSAVKSFVQDPLGAAETSLTKFASGFGVIGIAAGGSIAVLSAFATASIAATRSLAQLGIETQNISIKTGLSTREVGLFSFAAKAAGGDIGSFETAMRKLSAGLVDGGTDGKKAADALRTLGVASRASSGELRPMGEIFQDVAAGFGRMGSAAERNKLAVDLFGRSGIDLIPILERLNANLGVAKSLGLGLSDPELAKMKEYQSRITAIDAAWETAKRHFKESIAGTFFINIEGAGAKLLELLAGDQSSSGGAVADTHSTGSSSYLSYFLGLKGGSGSGDSIAKAFQQSRLNTPEGIEARIQELQEKNSTLAAGLRPGSGAGAAAVAKDKAEYDANEQLINRLKDQAKLIEKQNAAHVAILEQIQKLQQQGEGFYHFGAGALETVVSADEMAAYNPATSFTARRSVPSLFAPGAAPLSNDQLKQLNRPDLETNEFGNPMDQYGRFDTGTFVSTSADRGAATSANSSRADAFFAGSMQEGSDQDKIKLSTIHAELEARTRIFEMQAGPGGELDASEKAAKLRLQAAQEELAITGDIVAFEEQRTRIVLDREIQIAEQKRKEADAFRGLTGSVFDALTSRNPRALPDLIRGQALSLGRTVTENAAETYLLPSIQNAMPHLSSSLLKGTPFGPDPLKASASALDLSAVKLSAAADKLSAIRGGGGSSGTADGSGTGPVADLPLTSIPPGFSAAQLSSLGGSASPLSALAPLAKMLNSPSLGNFGSGASSTLSGYALSVASDSGFNTATRVGAGVGFASMLAAGGYGVYSGLKQGGVGGDLKAAGSAAGMAGSIISNVSKLLNVASPLLSAIPIVGSIAAMALPLIGGFFNNPQKRENAITQELSSAQYMAPTAINMTQSSSGTFTDFDAKGNIRTSNFSPYPQTTNPSLWQQTHGLFGPPPTWYDVPGGQTSQFGAPVAPPVVQHIYQAGSIQTMDAGSFHDFAQKNSFAIGEAAGKNLQAVHGTLATEVDRRISR